MDNPETLVTLCIQNTRQRQTKYKNATHDTENSKEEQHGPYQKQGVNPCTRNG